MVDTPALGAGALTGVEVRVLSPAPYIRLLNLHARNGLEVLCVPTGVRRSVPLSASGGQDVAEERLGLSGYPVIPCVNVERREVALIEQSTLVIVRSLVCNMRIDH